MTVIGFNQEKAYCEYMGIKFKASHRNNKYQFGNDQKVAIDLITIRITSPNKTILIKQVDVANTDVPFLLGLDFLDKYCMYVQKPLII